MTTPDQKPRTHSLIDNSEPVPEEQRKLEKLRHQGEEVREEVQETEKELDHKIETLKRSR